MRINFVFSILAMGLSIACQAKKDGPINLTFTQVQRHIFVNVKVNGISEPMELNLGRADSRVDPYMSQILEVKPVKVTLGGMEFNVPVQPAIGPTGFYQVDKKYAVGYLGQNVFKGSILLFSGSDQLTVFSPQQWSEFRAQSGLPESNTVAVPLFQLKSGLWTVPVKSGTGATLYAELRVGDDLISVSKERLNSVWLGLSSGQAEDQAGNSLVGGLSIGGQNLIPFGIAINPAPLDRYESGVTMLLPDVPIAGQAFAMDLDKNQLLVSKLNGLDLLVTILEGQSLLSCHAQDGKLYAGDDDNPSPQKQPYLSPISNIGAIRVGDLAKWILGQTATEVQYFEKAMDSILAAHSGTKPLKVTFQTPNGPVQAPVK